MGAREDQAFDEESGGEGVVFSESTSEAGADDQHVVSCFEGESGDLGGVQRRGGHHQRRTLAGQQRRRAVGGGLHGDLRGDRELLEGGGGVAGVEPLGREAALLAEQEDVCAVAREFRAELARLLDGGGGIDAAHALVHQHGDHGGGAQHIDHDAGAIRGRCGRWDEGDVDVHRGSVVAVGAGRPRGWCG